MLLYFTTIRHRKGLHPIVVGKSIKSSSGENAAGLWV